MRRPLNISYDMTYLDVGDDATNIGGVAPNVVAIVSVDVGVSKMAS
jgi:hypothetical protein